MFNLPHPIIEDFLFLIILAFMGWYDCKRFSLEPLSLVILMAMTVIGVWNLWIPVLLFVIGYGIMFLSAVIGDFICQRDSIAGGDMIISGVCCAYMGWKWFVVAFFLSAILGQIAIWFYYRHYRHLNIPYVPYLATGALIGMVIK